MYPTSEALPLAARPDLEQYKKQAKDLLAACRSGELDALRAWAIRRLEATSGAAREPLQDRAESIARFALEELDPPRLAAAQFVVARVHGFASWPAFAKHVRSCGAGAREPFESAADAVVDGDLAALERWLRADAGASRARSGREHGATLLHYATANGVENFRQRTPANVVAIARALIDAGADADADLTGGGRGTVLGLAATSSPLARSGRQLELLALVHAAGAHLDGRRGSWQPLLAALANARPEAARWLADRGALMTLVAAAGLGRMESVREFFDDAGRLRPSPPTSPAFGSPSDPRERLAAAATYAAVYGHVDVLAFLLDRGADPSCTAAFGQTALHAAAHAAQRGAVELLLARGAPLEATNRYGGSVLGQTLWSAVHAPAGWGGNTMDADHAAIVELLLAAGAKFESHWSTGIERIDALLRAARAR